MPAVIVELPSLLEAAAGSRRIELEADTLERALESLVTEHPGLRVHLFDETGRFREHVLCFHNGENTRWFDTLDRPIANGDVVTILQAVSGG